MISAKLNKSTAQVNDVSYVRSDIIYLHDNQGGTSHNTSRTTQQRVEYDRERFVRNHVGQNERDEQQVAVLANRLDLPSIFFLFTG
jgi:hypothetical protein